MRDMTSGNSLVLWVMNHVEIPFLNHVMKKGDVHCYSRDDIQKLCLKCGLKLEKYEVRKGFRLHAVIRNE